MTTVTFKEAAILSHIKKQPKLTVSRQLSENLRGEAKLVADRLISARRAKKAVTRRMTAGV